MRSAWYGLLDGEIAWKGLYGSASESVDLP